MGGGIKKSFGGHTKDDVIESNHSDPSKIMMIQPGVELQQKGKATKGDDLKVENKLNLSDYRSLVDPKKQQAKMAADRMKKLSSMAHNKFTGEDPYRAFKRHILSTSKDNRSKFHHS